MINTSSITSLYDSLTGAISSKLDALYANDKIDAETYAKILAQSFDEALKLSVSAVQQQEQLEKDHAFKDAQILNLASERARTQAQTLQVEAETLNTAKQGQLLEAQKAVQLQQVINLASEKLRSDAQTAQIQAETLNLPKQGALIDAQKEQTLKEADLAQQRINLTGEEILVKKEQVLVSKQEVLIAAAKLANIPKEGVLLDKQALDVVAKTQLTEQQKTNLAAEVLNIPKQGLLLDANRTKVTQEVTNLTADKLRVDAQTELTAQQKANAVIEGTVLVATECKLRAEFDLLKENVLKAASETSLLNQKKVTEQAQTTNLGVAADSVVGRQKALYLAQTDGFKRDAEQKATDLMIKTWATRRTTNEDTPADGVNKLSDVYIGQAVQKMLTGIGA